MWMIHWQPEWAAGIQGFRCDRDGRFRKSDANFKLMNSVQNLMRQIVKMRRAVAYFAESVTFCLWPTP